VAVRDSLGIFLEVLEAAPALGVPLEFEVYSGADPATLLAQLENASQGSIQSELSEVGRGQFTLQRSDPKAIYLAKGNLCKVKLGALHREAFWIEDPEDVLASKADTSGETKLVQGRGALAYLERASVYPAVWPVASAAVGSATGNDNGTGATSVAGLKPASVRSGDLLIAAITWVGGDTSAPATPPGWTLLEKDTNASALGLAVFARRATSKEPASWTWTFTSTRAATAELIRIANATGDLTSIQIAAQTGSGTAIANPSVSVGLVNGVLLTLASTTANTGITPPAGLTEAVDRGLAGRTAEIASLTNPSLGDSTDRTSTAGATGSWVGMSLFVPSNASGERPFSASTFGGILATLIDEAQARGAIPHLTYDFDDVVDSEGQPWGDVHELSFHIGTSLLDVWRQLVALGMEGLCEHTLRVRAFVDRSRHFEDTVILRKGHHLSDDVKETGHDSGLRTRYLVEGAGGRIVEVPDPTLEADLTVGRREGYVAMTTSDDATELQRAGDGALQLSRLESDARELPVHHGATSEGHYEPYVDYRVGDWISWEPAGDGLREAQRIVGFTLGQAGLDYSVELNLNSVPLEASVRLKRALDALSGSGSGTAAGGAFGLGGSSGGGSPAASADSKVAAVAGDQAGYLLDRLLVAGGIIKTLSGTAPNRRVLLTGPAKLDDLTDVDTSSVAPTNGQALVFDSGTGLWKPGTIAGGGGSGYQPGSPDAPPGAPSAYDDEFTSLIGWTTLGVLDILNVTDAASHVHLRNNSSTGIVIDGGIHKASPPVPFTVDIKLFDFLHYQNFNAAGLYIANAGATAFWTVFLPFTPSFSGQPTVDIATWSSRTTRTSVSETTAGNAFDWPQYMRLVVASNTSVTPYLSWKGRSWHAPFAAQNPGITIGQVGIYVQGNQAGVPSEAWVDFMRFKLGSVGQTWNGSAWV
jgi:hypothetical protein